MELSINKGVFENIISNMQPFLEKKDNSSITSHIFIKAEYGELEIKATDYEIGLKAKTDSYELKEGGLATVNGKKLLDIVKRLKDQDIVLKSDGENLNIKQGKSNFKLQMFDPSEFPSFPTTKNKPKIELNSLILIQSLKKISPAIDSNNPKFELNGALIDFKDGNINFVATDTRRLALMGVENSEQEELSIIVPKKAINEIKKLFYDEIDIFYDETNLIIKSNNYTFFTKLINGKYPDYERIIPKELKYTIKIPKDKMVESIKLINSIANEIKLTLRSDKIVIEALNEESSEAITEMEINTELNESFVIGVNSRFILDFLENIETSEFYMSINDANMPFVLNIDNFKTIVMPITI